MMRLATDAEKLRALKLTLAMGIHSGFGSGLEATSTSDCSLFALFARIDRTAFWGFYSIGAKRTLILRCEKG
jgi:hypothetical protein